MSIGMWVVAVILAIVCGMLARGFLLLGQLDESFWLLDRAKRLLRLRQILMAGVVLVTGCVITLVALILVARNTPVAPLQVEAARPEPVQAPAPPQPEPEPPAEAPNQDLESDARWELATEIAAEPQTETPLPAEPEPEPEPEPEAPQPQSTPSYDWLLARIVSGGDVTLRAVPNGGALRMLSPGERVLTRNELRSAGGHTWVRVRTPSGEAGWVVSRFVKVWN